MIIRNNSHNEFGTSILFKNEFPIENVNFDTKGRTITLNTGESIIVNVYPKAGLDSESKKEREKLIRETLPKMI